MLDVLLEIEDELHHHVEKEDEPQVPRFVISKVYVLEQTGMNTPTQCRRYIRLRGRHVYSVVIRRVLYVRHEASLPYAPRPAALA